MARPGVLLVTHIILLLVVHMVISNGNTTTSSLGLCSCYLSGQVYNLKFLARLDGTASLIVETNDHWMYGYNPCAPFSIGGCQDVAVCRWDAYGQSFKPLGLQNDGYCQPSEGMVELVYNIPNSLHWKTRIRLKCNLQRSGVNDALFTIIENTAEPVLQIEHKCSCPDACIGDSPTRALYIFPGNAGSVTGGIIGGTLTIILLVGLIFFLFRRRRRQRRQHRAIDQDANRHLLVEPPFDYEAIHDGAPDPVDEAPDPVDGAPDPVDEAPDPVDGAPDPVDGAPDPAVDGATDPFDGASYPDDGMSNPVDGVLNRVDDRANPEIRGESPHIANFIPNIPDRQLSRPIAVSGADEDQYCEDESYSPAREPVENSL